jgi:hypothetical protein
VTTWALGNLVLNQQAYELLADTLVHFGEFLEARCEGIAYHIFNTLKVIPDEYIVPETTMKKSAFSWV